MDLVRLQTREQRNIVNICFALICNSNPAQPAEQSRGLQFAGQEWGKGLDPFFSYQVRAELCLTRPPPHTELLSPCSILQKDCSPFFNGKSEVLNVLEYQGLARLGYEYNNALTSVLETNKFLQQLTVFTEAGRNTT